MQLAETICTIALDEVDLLQINPSMNFISQKIATTFSVGSDTYQ